MTPSTPKRILVVEDEPSIREGLVETIESDGLRAIPVDNGLDAILAFSTQGADLILLDIMLPGMNGYDVCRKIRERDKRVPILLLTAKSEEIDKVLGLELGADDYITKPFRVRELLARIHAALRRGEFMSAPTPVPETSEPPSRFTFGPVTVDPKSVILIRDGQEIEITERELTLIELFRRHPNHALNRDFLLNEAWSIDYAGTTRTLDQHIAKLRAKISPDTTQSCIKTVHGIGYKYVP